MVANSWLRSGNSGSSNNSVCFLRETIDILRSMSEMGRFSQTKEKIKVTSIPIKPFKIKELVENGDKLNTMRKNAEAISKPFAADDIDRAIPNRYQ